MKNTNTKSDIQDELNKAARLINAILRLMHRGAMQHDQARLELSALAKGIAKTEIEHCVKHAIRAVDINEQGLQEINRDNANKPVW